MSEAPNRVTLRDIARKLGISHSTVSLALKNNPKIAKKTRHLVQDEAIHSGYRPEPMLSALAAYRQMKKTSVYHGTIAWLYSRSTTASSFYSPPYQEGSLFWRYYHGAIRQAELLGYRIQEYLLDEPDMSSERMSKILMARGIQGIIVGPQSALSHDLKMRWEWFSAVRMGFSLHGPALSVISSTQYRNSLLATNKLLSLGYKRIGFFGSENFDDRTDGNFTAGYRTATKKVITSRQIPILLTRDGAVLLDTVDKIRRWVKRWKIDAIVCVTGMQNEIAEAGYRIPEDLAVALLTHNKNCEAFSGIDEQGERTGSAAVNCIVNMIHCGERGVPEVPFQMLIEGTWVDGKTAPPATA